MASSRVFWLTLLM
jgi:hypothetical protein